MLVQFEVDNQDGLLKPGSFAQVALGIPGAEGMLRLPASALVFRSERDGGGLFVIPARGEGINI